MKYDLFELSVAVPSKHGSTKIPEYGVKGLTFVEGRRGQKFTLKLRNDAAQRVMAVISIDGLSVLDGEPCTDRSRGYVIPAYSTVEIEGWRTSLSKIHEFTFEPKEQSYAKGSETNSAQNCGVIAAKFFSEKWKPNALLEAMKKTLSDEHHHHHHHYPYTPPPPPYTPPPPWPPIWYTTCGTSAAPNSAPNLVRCTLTNSMGQSQQYSTSIPETPSIMSCSLNHPGVSTKTNDASLKQSDVPDFTLGTGWGKEKTDVVTETTFEIEKELCTLTVYYAEAAYMEKVGIIMKKDLAVTPPPTPVLPQAFGGFCKAPVNR
jgi:hypothetical protein